MFARTCRWVRASSGWSRAGEADRSGAWAPLVCGLLGAFTVLFSALLGAPAVVRAEADTLAPGDLSLALFEALEPFNRYWYHYRVCGEVESVDQPCSRFNLNSYDVIDVPVVYGEPRPIETNLLASTGLRIEYGIFDRLTFTGETQFVYSSRGTPSATLGDSRLGARWRLSGNEGPLVVSLAGGAKLPGLYEADSLAAPGGGQPDLEFKSLFGGLAYRRRLFYDVGFGYRLRLPYRNAGEVVVAPITYASPDDTEGEVGLESAQQYIISGPADEVFLDLTLGLFASRRMMLLLNINAVNSTKGFHLDDYFRTSWADDQGRPRYEVTGGADNLLTSLEEDFIRVGFGALFKPFLSGTVYVDYSYIVAGQNRAAFYVIPGTRIPIGALSAGLEVTFGTRGKPSASPALAGTIQEKALARRFSAGSSSSRTRP